MIRRPPRSPLSSSSAASDVYKRQNEHREMGSETSRALYQGARNGDDATIVQALKEGADINVDPESSHNPHGWGPLHVAVNYNRRSACALLLKHRAHPHATDKLGKTPLDLARGRFPELFELLTTGSEPSSPLGSPSVITTLGSPTRVSRPALAPTTNHMDSAAVSEKLAQILAPRSSAPRAVSAGSSVHHTTEEESGPSSDAHSERTAEDSGTESAASESGHVEQALDFSEAEDDQPAESTAEAHELAAEAQEAPAPHASKEREPNDEWFQPEPEPQETEETAGGQHDPEDKLTEGTTETAEQETNPAE
eukprot:TRINITY_DN16036_c0_g1_i4.p1 TRINITY_DN16036_c0_g1~~TRINITY_DN16036_c0_g1_i4.p1  ORF type:complete len:310 (-),score=62.40 TRINITY_DN16036_c0_g1_i4:249-1178(-)